MKKIILFVDAMILSAMVMPALSQSTAAPGTAPRVGAMVEHPALRGMKRTAPVKARVLTSESKFLEVAFVAMSDEKVGYANADSPNQIQGAMPIDAIVRTQFEISIDDDAVTIAEKKGEFIEAYRLISTAVAPCVPYLALPDNNAVEYVERLGSIMMRIADRGRRTASTPDDKARIMKQYETAYNTWQQLAKAEWSPLSQLAVVKACQCLLRMGKVKTAQYYMDDMAEPSPGDVVYGHYWLTHGYLAANSRDFRKAMDAAVRSLDFENKNIDTFPPALMLSARCYEEMQEWHRARDVYFEVASIFPGTEYADEAAARLGTILKNGKTDEKEEMVIENVFFAVNENINDLSRELLEKRSKAAAAANSQKKAIPAARK